MKVKKLSEISRYYPGPYNGLKELMWEAIHTSHTGSLELAPEYPT